MKGGALASFWGFRDKQKHGSFPLGPWEWASWLSGMNNSSSVSQDLHLRHGENWTRMWVKKKRLATDIHGTDG